MRSLWRKHEYVIDLQPFFILSDEPVAFYTFPDQEKQRQIHQQYLNANRNLGQKQADGLCKTGKAARAKLVRCVKPAKVQRGGGLAVAKNSTAVARSAPPTIMKLATMWHRLISNNSSNKHTKSTQNTPISTKTY